MSGQIYVFSGPSGAGKSTIIQQVRKELPGLGYCVSHTSREPRGRERDGADYHFVDRKTFQGMIDKGAFIEWAQVYEDYYGTSVSSLETLTGRGMDVVMDVDVQGARNVKDRFPACVLIFILPPSLEVLERRLRERATDRADAVHRRIDKAVKEIRNCVWYDYIIFNDDREKAVDEAKSVIVSERCRRSKQLSKVEKIFGLSPT